MEDNNTSLAQNRYKSISSKDFITVVDTETGNAVHSSSGQLNFNFIELLYQQKEFNTIFTLGSVEHFVYQNLSDVIEKVNLDYFLIHGDERVLIPQFSAHLRELCLDISSFKNLEYFKLFVRKLLQNESQDQLSYFLEYLSSQKFMINEDGNIICYKAIKDNFMDKHSGKISNNIGNVVKMDRKEVTQNTNQTCAPGLHVGNKSYIKSYCSQGDVFIAVEIDPRNLVSVPGISEGKIRVCEYKVLCRVSFDTTLEATKFFETKDFIAENGLPEIGKPKQLTAAKPKQLTAAMNIKEVVSLSQDAGSTPEDFVKWMLPKIQNSTTKSITWGNILKLYKKYFPNLTNDTAKLYVMKYFTFTKDTVVGKSKITLRDDSTDYHC